MEANQEAATAPEASSAPAQSNTLALSAERGGILGVKAGMTQVYNQDGEALAVTVIQIQPNVVTQVKAPAKEGYQAVQVGLLEKKAKAVTKPEQGHAKKSGKTGFYHYQEFRFSNDAKLGDVTVGQILSAEFLKPGDLVDLTAVSKGKGFQGGMKRYHMHGGNKTHGNSVSHRSLGSIGNRADPAKCWKGIKMPGQMGNVRRTVQNIEVIGLDQDAAGNTLLLVHGSVPGPRNGVVTVHKAIKALQRVTRKAEKRN